tara:strand:- start:948 stop:1130 length:183 start_codon:yes stop_codon:yes gene_type:complete
MEKLTKDERSEKIRVETQLKYNKERKQREQELLTMRVNSIKKWQMLSRQSQPSPINDTLN